jgi:DNA-binding MarR family transcriptional regulator
MVTKYEQLFLENQLCFPLYAASRLTTKIYTPYLNALGLTYPQYLVLLVLWEHEKQTVNEIGERLFLESNTLTPLLKRMEQKGLLQRERSKEDERSVTVSLSNNGANLKQQAVSIPHQLIASLHDDSITEQELLDFQRTLHKLIDLMNRKN